MRLINDKLCRCNLDVIWPGGNWLQHFVERWPQDHNKDCRRTGRALTRNETGPKTPPWPGERGRGGSDITRGGFKTGFWSFAVRFSVYRQVVAAVAADQCWLIVAISRIPFVLQTSNTKNFKSLQQPGLLLLWQRAWNTTTNHQTQTMIQDHRANAAQTFRFFSSQTGSVRKNPARVQPPNTYPQSKERSGDLWPWWQTDPGGRWPWWYFVRPCQLSGSQVYRKVL